MVGHRPGGSPVPWREVSPVDERLRFVARVGEGERVTDLCREFGISRKTGHKILRRYREDGLVGLTDQRRVPQRIPHRTPPEIRAKIVEAKRRHLTWGPKKLKAWLERKEPGVVLPEAILVVDILESPLMWPCVRE